jgi:exonuclease III
MKLIAWNCRGLGNSMVVRSRLDIQTQEDPSILFLSKTKLATKQAEAFRWKLGLTNMICRPSEGRSGGIALFWRNGIDVSLKAMSKYFIDVEVGGGENKWRFTGIYGEPRSDKKDITWKAIQVLRHNLDPWLCMGDFNEILFQHEKQGGVQRP